MTQDTDRPRLRTLAKAGRLLWQNAVPRQARESAHKAFQLATSQLPEAKAIRALGRMEQGTLPGSVLVSGLLEDTKGVSQAARLTLSGLSLAGIKAVGHDLTDLLEGPRDGVGGLPFASDGGVWVLPANPPEAVNALLSLRPETWTGRRRIGYWVWELPQVPVSWVRLSRVFHEIWVPSVFVADSLAASGVTTPIRVVPYPVALEVPRTAPDRASFGIGADATVVLTMGDLNSSADRKNLLGAIEIFRQAFPDADDKTQLVVKTQGEEDHPGFRAKAEEAAMSRPDIRFLFGALPRQRIWSLIASSDILFSPHRSEGFGLSLAEALLIGVPALATGWSGNLDFMHDIPELLIDCKIVPMRDNTGIYETRHQKWAEPNIRDASAKLKALVGDQALRGRLAAAGRTAVEALSKPWRPGGEVSRAISPHLRQAVPALAQS